MTEQQSKQQRSVWIILLGTVVGIGIALGINSFLSKRTELSTQSIRSIEPNKFTLDQLMEQKQILLKQISLIEEAISIRRPNQRLEIPFTSEKETKTIGDNKPAEISKVPSPTATSQPIPKAASPPTVAVSSILNKPPSPSKSLEPQQSPKCKYSFKVYVYDIPSNLAALKISEEARQNGTLHVCRKCILEQFSLEYIVLDYFLKFCGRTMNPDEADYFYLPLVRDAEYRQTMHLGGQRSRAPSSAEQALLQILEKDRSDLWKTVFNITDKYWYQKKGANHIVVMPAPVTNLRHESSRRGFFHYMIHLKSPIFIGLEYSKSFVDEYPICSSKKNIVAPYPTIDPDLYNGKLLHFSINRDYLLYYAGGLHGDCIEVRTAMRNMMQNSTKLNKVVPPIKRNMNEREHGFLGAKFCPIPVGDSPSSKRMYDVLNYGCVPVVLSDDLIWAFSDQTGGLLNHSSFSIQMPQSVVQYQIDHSLRRYKDQPEKFGFLPSGKSLYQILLESKKNDPDFENGIYVNPLVRVLRRIPQSDIEYLQKNGVEAAKHYRYYQMNKDMNSVPTAHHFFPDGGAMEMIAEELEERKKQGISNVHEECAKELGRKHNYVHRYPCESDKKESLIVRRMMRLR
eukprot:gene1367-1448_t